MLSARQGVSAVGLGVFHFNAVDIPLTRRLRESEGATLGPVSDTRQQRSLLVLGAGVHDGVRCENHRRVIRGADQSAAHLFEDDAELDERKALAAILLWDLDSCEAELLSHLVPDSLVVAV